MIKKLKLANEALESLQTKSNNLLEENKALQKQVKDKTDHLVLKNAEIYNTRKEAEAVQNDLIKTKEEQELKISELKQSKI